MVRVAGGTVRQTRAGKDGVVDQVDTDALPTFDLVASDLEASGDNPPMFDFGPDPERPANAPVAALPPWMRATAPAVPAIEGESDSGRRGRALPRARTHRRPPATTTAVFEAPVLEARAVELPVETPSQAPQTVAQAAAAARFLTVEGDIAAEVAPAVPAPAQPAVPAPSRVAAAPPARGDKVRRVTTWAGLTMVLAGGVGALYVGMAGGSSSATPLPASQLAAGQWVMDNVGATASLLAPTSVAKALTKDGFDAGRVIPYADGPSGSTGSVTNPQWNCCNVLFVSSPVGDSSVRDGLPVALRPAYDQSRALASFTSDGQTTELRQVLNGTSAEITASLNSEHTVLVNAGKEVLASKKLHLSAAATQAVKDGQVDSRVLLAIVGIAARHDVWVLDFPIGDAETAVDGLAREVRIDKMDGKPLAAGSAAVSDADAFLNMQVDPYKPAGMQLSDPDGSGTSLLVIRYDAPGPLGLITPRSQ
jgi:hypothetical protein